MAIERGTAAPSLVLERARLMTKVITTIRSLALRNEGQDLIEYGLLTALIAAVAVFGVTTLGDTIYKVFWSGIGQVV
jgi:Flp pilus assembly pilin Flp